MYYSYQYEDIKYSKDELMREALAEKASDLLDTIEDMLSELDENSAMYIELDNIRAEIDALDYTYIDDARDILDNIENDVLNFACVS